MCAQNDLDDDNFDSSADIIIRKCININKPQSFFLLAGAGSGKTRSLVNALKYLDESFGNDLLLLSKKIAVITYTNAARDEILSRVDYNPLFSITTIHSFAWELISPYTNDIKDWLGMRLIEKIKETEAAQNGPRVSTTSKAYQRRVKEIEKYNQRLEYLPNIKKFIYSPDGNNGEKNSLNHSEVIKITADLLTEKETLQQILIDKFPVLLVDECQDTKAELLRALILVQNKFKYRFTVGLFGDTMQRIYLDGITNLVDEIPPDWEFPEKKMNHRCQKRIVDLCNAIRNDEKFIQKPRRSKDKGFVRIFIIDRSETSLEAENKVIQHMATVTADEYWKIPQNIKFLTIEHDMAAKRLGFLELFEPLYNVQSFKTSVLDGTLSALQPLLKVIVPLWTAVKNNDDVEIMKIIRKNSPMYILAAKTNVIDATTLEVINYAIEELKELWKSEKDPSCRQIIESMVKTDVFNVTDDLRILVTASGTDDEKTASEDKYEALEKALTAPFSQVLKYSDYINDLAWFSTHQGVKGLEYRRVVVVIDDAEAEGFTTFSYDKLFGLKEKSDTDLRNERDGKETTIDRTRRLFYVTCSRAEDGLAIIYYTDDIQKAEKKIKSSGFFHDNEICKL